MRGRGNERVECPEKAPPACESLGSIKRRIEAGSLQYCHVPPPPHKRRGHSHTGAGAVIRWEGGPLDTLTGMCSPDD